MNAISRDERAPDAPAPGLLGLAERGLVPDALVRRGIRRLCAQRLRQEREGGPAAQSERFMQRVAAYSRGPLAVHADAANAQHYELPPAFFALCLGARMKYSSCYYPRGDETLDQAEEAMLALYGERAGLANGQDILELGCGWGSLTLWMAQRFPHSRITAVSNSRPQREFIEARCRAERLDNVRIVTCDVNGLELPACRFDRVVSIEMFEHMRNYERLMGNIAAWLRPGGLFVASLGVHTDTGTIEPDWLGAPMYFSGYATADNQRFIERAGLHIVSAREETIRENSRPTTFLWVVARQR